MSFEAWHGSKSGYCGFMEGYREVDVAWFSFYRGEAEEFARQAWQEGYLPTLCKVLVQGSRYSLFDAESDLDEDGERNLLECLKRKGVTEESVPYIISGILNYEFTAFDPDGGGTDSVQVVECIRELGYIGWLERESHNDDPANFGLFDPARNVTVLEEIKICPERGMTMEKIDDNTYECGCCDACGIYKTCEFCGQVLEYVEEDDEWTYPCHCDFRQNPSDECRYRYFDLRDVFRPEIHTMKYDLSSAVAEALESKRTNVLRDISPRDFDIFGLVDVPKDPRIFQSALQEEIEFQCETEEEVLAIAEKMRDHFVFRHFMPPYFGYSDVHMIEEPFWFVHFTSRDNALAIQDHGFIGREDPEALFSTKHGIQSELKEDGYVFGYRLKASSSQEAINEVVRTFKEFFAEKEENYFDDPMYPYYAVGPSFIVARTDFGVEGFHSMDNERQVIVPTQCIEQRSVTVALDALSEFGVEDYE